MKFNTSPNIELQMVAVCITMRVVRCVPWTTTWRLSVCITMMAVRCVPWTTTWMVIGLYYNAGRPLCNRGDHGIDGSGLYYNDVRPLCPVDHDVNGYRLGRLESECWRWRLV
jgi:hypothetical protein